MKQCVFVSCMGVCCAFVCVSYGVMCLLCGFYVLGAYVLLLVICSCHYFFYVYVCFFFCVMGIMSCMCVMFSIFNQSPSSHFSVLFEFLVELFVSLFGLVCFMCGLCVYVLCFQLSILKILCNVNQ
jgi:hypothetical protein